MIEGTFYTPSATSTDDGIEFDNVDMISFVNDGTFGKPAIIAPGDDHVHGNIRVLYINTKLVAALEVSKT